MSQEDQASEQTSITRLSEELACAVDKAGKSTVTVDARRRLPATGIVWNKAGLVVTANHVVERDEDIVIFVEGGASLEATLVGRDKGTDVALLSVDATDLAPPIRTSMEPRPGHLVLAVGRPKDYGLSASLGVISLVGGPWRTAEGTSVDQFIRSDAAMLPGFSGGPMADASGATIGMNSSSVGRRGGLTIPFDIIDAMANALQTHGRIRRGYLGIGAQSIVLNNRLAESLQIEQDRGLVVVGLESEGPGETGGLLLGDVIVLVEDTPIATVEEMQERLTGDTVGKLVTLKLVRGGQLLEVPIRVGDRH